MNEASISEDNRASTFQIAESADFKELTVGYTRKYYEIDRNGLRKGEEKTEFVEMDQPRPCCYNKKHYWDCHHKKWVTEPEKMKAPSPHTNSSDPPVEYRGITLRQLWAAHANMKRRCEEEEWKDCEGNLLTPDKVTLYEINKFIIKPFTMKHQKSFVSALPSTAGPQPPRFFVSHWWGEPVNQFIECIEQAVRDFSYNYSDEDEDDQRGGGMTCDTPVWVCAYANNQWELSGDIPDDPKEAGFTNAMKVAQNRTLTILDKEATVFTRIWCCYEMFRTLIDAEREAKGGLWAVYTAHTHAYKHALGEEERQALGIISGGATIDRGVTENTATREELFPFELISEAPTIKVEKGKTSVKHDRIHILNSIAGNTGDEINKTPPNIHILYDKVNDTLRAAFVSTQDRLLEAWKQSEEVWMSFLHALSKGKKEINEMSFNFGKEWSELPADRAIQLVDHLPPTIKALYINDANFGKEFIDAVIKHVGKSLKLERLDLDGTKVGDDNAGQDAGVRLVNVLASNNTITSLELRSTDLLGSMNVKHWGDTLMKMTSLRYLWLSEVGEEIKNELELRTKNRTPNLYIG